jgi:hypothetical protein
MLDEHGTTFKAIPLSEKAMRVLEEIRDEFKAAFGREPRDDDFVFPLTYMYSDQEVEQQTIQAMREAGVRPAG